MTHMLSVFLMIMIPLTSLFGSTQSTDLNTLFPKNALPTSIHGRVVKGEQKARELQCPTANIEFDPKEIVLNSGVYAAYTYVEEKEFKSIAYYNMDWRPTILESHLFEWDKTLYDQEITVILMYFMRPSIDFSTLTPEEIANQIQKDIQSVKEWHSTY